MFLAPRPGSSQTPDSTSLPPTTTAQECCIELRYPLSARMLAQGSAVVADSSADMVLANPAGLIGLRRPQLTVHYRRMPADGQVLGLSFVSRPYGFGTFALSYVLTDYGTVEGTGDFGEPTGSTYSQVHVLFATFGTTLRPGLSGGLTYKLYVWITPASSDSTTGRGASGVTQLVDIGLQYHPRGARWLALGASLTNAGIPLQVVNFEQSDNPPLRGRIGARYEVLHLFHADSTVTGSLALQAEAGGPASLVPGVGAEISVGGVVAVRAGWRGGGALEKGVESGAALGVGLHIQRYTLSVARSLTAGPLDVGSSPFNVTFGVSF